MKEKKLLIASAPLDAVRRAGEWLARQSPDAAFSLLVKESRAAAAQEALPGWRIITYQGEVLSVWGVGAQALADARSAASGGVVYLCNNRSGAGYLNVSVLAHHLSPGRAVALTHNMSPASSTLPEPVLELLASSNSGSLRERLESCPEYIAATDNLARIVQSTRAAAGPRRVHLSVSTACNYKCVMCSFHSPRATADSLPPECSSMPPGYKSPEDLKKVVMGMDDFITIVDGLSQTGAGTIVFTGFGEPLLNPRIGDMLRYVAGKGMESHIITNGLLMDEERRNGIFEGGARAVHISLNSASPETYSQVHTNMAPGGFHKTAGNIRALVRERKERGLDEPRIGVSFVLSKINAHEIGEMLSLCLDCGVDYISLVPVYVFPQITDLLLDAEEQLRIRSTVESFKTEHGARIDLNTDFSLWNPEPLSTKRFHSEVPCYIGWVFTQITSWGDVRPCCACARVMGNALETPFAEVWNGGAYIEMRESMAALPRAGRQIGTCGCYNCGHVGENSRIHHIVTSVKVEVQ